MSTTTPVMSTTTPVMSNTTPDMSTITPNSSNTLPNTDLFVTLSAEAVGRFMIKKMEELSTHLGLNTSTLYDELHSFAKDSFPASTGDVTTILAKEDFRNSALAVVEIVVLVLIMVVAVIGNVFVLIALWRHSLFQPMSRCYLFMLHLSLADLLVALLNILPQLIWEITYRFRGSDLLCRLVKYAQVFVLYVSTYVLVFMAVDRARAVQGSGRGSLRAARLMVAGAWVLGLVLATPQTLLFAVREVEPGVLDCWVVFELVSERMYVTWFVVSVFLLPLAIIAVCYGYICWAVWHSAGTTSPRSALRRRLCFGCLRWQSSAPSERRMSMELQPISRVRGGSHHHHLPHAITPVVDKVSAAKMKTVRMTLTIVFAFAICWAPFCIAQLLTVYNKPQDLSTMNPVAVVCMLLGSLNSCTNPWIYLYFSGTLLNQLRVVLGFGPSCSSDNVSIGDQEPQQRRHDPSRRPVTHSNVV
ncbi:oxytocin receptor-like [Homarus americanus]|uniref:Vasopressin V1a receptor-like 1 n=1 Tax=Homarus americanus TaxID=6706 RepID=A0A8J5JP90_HOMAM|nr:oxytocin receptor-like [Homarus americanus]KAG7161787.1 Vasopressin V1a receptor-like 1 [Homarus americanus]